MADEGKSEDPAGASESKPSTETSDLDKRDRSEWTASDSRGPLGTAGEGAAAPMSRESHADPEARAEVAAASGTPAETDPAVEPVAPASGAETKPAGAPSVAEPAVAEAPHDAPPSAEPASAPPRSAIWPVAAAIVLGALAGAGSAYLIYNTSPGAGADSKLAALSARVDALEQRPADGASKAAVADLSRKVAALESKAAAAPQGAQGDDEIAKRVAALETRVASLKTQAPDVTDLAAKITSLESTLAGMRKETSSAQAGVADVAGQQRSMASEQKLLADKVMVPALAVVADSLVQQIDRGEPYATQVAALESLAADPAKIAILKQNADKGVASAKTLEARFAPLAGPLSAASVKAPADAGFVDRLRSGMMSMVSVRAEGDSSGTDTPSRVAHIKADLAHDNVADALATWDALPSDARAKGEDWGLLAKAHVEAMSAARALQHDAIVALGAKKS